MRVQISEFPYQPQTMECCKECLGKKKKDCMPHPLNCIDFYIANINFINKKIQDKNGDQSAFLQSS